MLGKGVMLLLAERCWCELKVTAALKSCVMKLQCFVANDVVCEKLHTTPLPELKVKEVHLNAMSAAYHAAIFEVIWPSPVSNLCARFVPVWLVSSAADGIHVQPFSSWVKQLSEVCGAQIYRGPCCHALAAFQQRRSAYATNVAPQSADGHWSQSE